MITPGAENKDISSSNFCAQYNQNGYLVFDPKIPESLIDKAVSEVSSEFLETDESIKSEQGVIFYRHRIQDAFWFSGAARELAVFRQY